MDSQKKPIALLSLLALCTFVLIAVVRPARGDEIATAEELPLTSYLPLVGDAINAPPSVFGVQTYGSSTPGAVYTSYLLATSASWVRTMVQWSSAEPANTDPANYDWRTIDSVLALAQQSSPQLIVTIDGVPLWAADKVRGPIYPHMVPEFVQFVTALVERYDGDGFQDAPGRPVVRYWEIFNEPDASFERHELGGYGENGAAYAQMLSAVYPAIKQASNEAKVLFGGLAYDFWEVTGGPFVQSFLDDVLAAGAGPYFDIMNYHLYPNFWRRWTDDGSSGLYEKAQAIRNKLAAYHLDKPVVITEAGWHSNYDPLAPSSLEQQARYVTELFAESMAADIDIMIWWMLYDGGDGQYDTGLVTNGTPPQIKPSFNAFKTALARLGTAEFGRRLPTPPPVFPSEDVVYSMDAYEFNYKYRNEKLIVAWMNPVNANVTWQLQIPVPYVNTYNIYNQFIGRVNDGDDGASDGFVTISVTSQPVFVETPW